MQPFYEYRHVVGFAETNLVGNVYYTHYLSWQGRCRELFLRDHAPDVLDELQRDLALVTVRVSCEFLDELAAFDRVSVRMWLASYTQNRATMRFEYWRSNGTGSGAENDGEETLVARGEQQVASMRRRAGGVVPAPFPPSMQAALAYMAQA